MADPDDNGLADASPPGEAVAALIAEGDHLRAAALALASGDLRRAVGIYDRLWRFADALPLAIQLADWPLAVRLALDAGDHARAVALADAMPDEPAGELVRAARALTSRGRHWDAARLAERAGESAMAIASYRRAGALVDVGRIEEAAARHHEAGLAYEEARARAASPGERAAADLALGRLLARLGRLEDAARCFQAAGRDAAHRLPAGRALVGALRLLGLGVAAAEAAIRLRRLDPTLPPSLEEIGALDAADAVAGASSVGRVPGEPRAWARRFKIARVLGAGATSHVYRAEDTLLGQEVALKLLSLAATASGAGFGDAGGRDAYARFAREAEAAGRLRHPNILALHDADPAAGLFVWELMVGGSLADRLGTSGSGRLSPGAGRRLALDLLAALAAAHDAGIVHRDVKPANVLYDGAGNAKLGDFGAAHLVDFGQTQTGGLLGTLAYMAPEQITGGAIGPAADLYALAVTLFEALTGRLPFLGPDIVAQHLGEAAPRPSEVAPELGPEHDAVLERALRKAPDERWESAREMAEAVARWPTTPRLGSPRAADAGGAAAPGETTAEVATRPSPAAAADQAESDRDVPLGPSRAGQLFHHEDERLGRPVLVERRDGAVEGPSLARLRALAAAGGPLVQRVLALSDDGRTVTYELVPGPRASFATLPTALAGRLRAAAEAVSAARGVEGRPGELEVILSVGGPVIQVID